MTLDLHLLPAGEWETDEHHPGVVQVRDGPWLACCSYGPTDDADGALAEAVAAIPAMIRLLRQARTILTDATEPGDAPEVDAFLDDVSVLLPPEPALAHDRQPAP